MLERYKKVPNPHGPKNLHAAGQRRRQPQCPGTFHQHVREMKRVSYPRYAVRTIQSYLDNIKKEKKGIKSSHNIEYVHRMRIASRRLRAAFTVFDDLLGSSELKKWKKDIRALGRALGKARELDVQMQFLKILKTKFKDASVGTDIKKLLKILRCKKDKAQIRIISTLNKMKKKKTIKKIQKYLGEISTSQQLYNRKEKLTHASMSIRTRLAHLLGYERYVLRPEKAKELHEIRIAAKHLRYALEIFEPLYGSKLHRFSIFTRRVQDVLGDLHELDVWLPAFPSLTREAGIQKKKSASLLHQTGTALRKQTYTKFLTLWNETKRKHLWQKLKAII